MDIILITTAVITVIGAIVGAGLVFTGKKFAVEVDEREAAVREALPGNNCGACGYAGCDAMAAAIASGEAPVNGCPVGGNPVAEKIGVIMGVEAGAVVRKIAFVRCKGSCEYTQNQQRDLRPGRRGRRGPAALRGLRPVREGLSQGADRADPRDQPGGGPVLQPGPRPPGQEGLLRRLHRLHALHPAV